MKKLLALMSFVVLSAMLSFAGTITYYNRTSETVRFRTSRSTERTQCGIGSCREEQKDTDLVSVPVS